MRGAFVFVAGLVCLCLVGGAALFVKVLDTAETAQDAADAAQATAAVNSKFICAFGGAIGAQPVKQRDAETDQEFRQRVALTRQFVKSLGAELEDCNVPTDLVIDPSSKDVLEKPDRAPEGVDAGGGNKPSGKPSPPKGGRKRPPPPVNPGGNTPQGNANGIVKRVEEVKGIACGQLKQLGLAC